jgi:hypothetical protein
MILPNLVILPNAEVVVGYLITLKLLLIVTLLLASPGQRALKTECSFAVGFGSSSHRREARKLRWGNYFKDLPSEFSPVDLHVPHVQADVQNQASYAESNRRWQRGPGLDARRSADLHARVCSNRPGLVYRHGHGLTVCGQKLGKKLMLDVRIRPIERDDHRQIHRCRPVRGVENRPPSAHDVQLAVDRLCVIAEQ